MLKIILKNLWNRRGRYAWLFIELVIVTCLTWYIVDKTAVSLTDRYTPIGYDADRLIKMTVSSLPEGARGYDSTRVSKESRETDFYRLRAMLEGMQEIESVAVANNYMNEQSISLNRYMTKDADTLINSVNTIAFYPGQKFFETYGIEAVPGSPSAEELSARSYTPMRDVVITEDYARLFWPEGDAFGKRFVYPLSDGSDTIYTNVVGVVRNVRYQTFNRTNCALFLVWGEFKYPEDFEFILRLSDGVDAEAFALELIARSVDGLKAGNYYCKSVTPYRHIIEEAEYNYGVTADRNKMMMLAAFFLINLVLGVTGSFYLQVRRRVQEMGVHRSFGARRGHVMAMVIGEGVALTTVAFIVGDIIYLQYALHFGLDHGFGNNMLYNLIDNWIGHFGEHFAIISAMVYLLMLLCTLAGSWLPARTVSRVNPVEALRNE